MLKALLDYLWPPVSDGKRLRRRERWFCVEAARRSPDLARLLALRIKKQIERSDRKARDASDAMLSEQLADYNRRVNLCGVVGGMPDDEELSRIMEMDRWRRMADSMFPSAFSLEYALRRYQDAEGGY